MRWLILLALVSACATVPAQAASTECITACGLHARGNCAALQRLEEDTVRNLARFVDTWTEADVCGALAGWRVEVHEAKPSDDLACGGAGWVLFAGFCAGGYTHRADHWVEVTSTNWRGGALAHELVHVVDLTRYGHAGHCRWQERGVKRALLEITGREDPSASDCSE